MRPWSDFIPGLQRRGTPPRPAHREGPGRGRKGGGGGRLWHRLELNNRTDCWPVVFLFVFLNLRIRTVYYACGWENWLVLREVRKAKVVFLSCPGHRGYTETTWPFLNAQLPTFSCLLVTFYSLKEKVTTSVRSVKTNFSVLRSQSALSLANI